MTRDEARQQIQDMLGHRSDLVNDIERAFRYVQNSLESAATLPFFLRKVDDTFVTVAGENIIERPDDYIRLWDEDPFSLIFTNESGAMKNVSLKKASQRALRQQYSSALYPMGFSEVGIQFQLFPVPTQEYPLIISYYAKDTPLVANIENMWLANLPDLMIGRAGFIVATGIRDQNAQTLFGGLAAAGTEQLAGMSTAQDEAGSRPVIGGDD